MKLHNFFYDKRKPIIYSYCFEMLTNMYGFNYTSFSILIQCQPRFTIYIYGLKQSITIYHKIFVKLHLYLNASKFASLSDAL